MFRKLIFILSCFAIFIAEAQITTWKGPEGFSSDAFFQVKVNGTPVEVYNTPMASYCSFDFEKGVTVEVTTKYDVRWVDIRPSRLNISPEYVTDNTFRFVLEKPENISVELNGRIKEQNLFIFSDKPVKEAPLEDKDNIIRFEAGKLYSDVHLELEDNQTVYIEGGAVVQGTIAAKNKENIKIKGKGILDGSLNEQNNRRGIDFSHCKNISIEDIILHNGTRWQVALFHSSDIHINNIKIVSEDGGDDGIDLVQCQNVLVENSFIRTKDDCVAVKSGSMSKSFDPTIPTDNILVRNCTFWNSIWGNAIEIGFELYSDEVKNVRFENIDILHVEAGAALSIHNAGPSHVFNISFEDIRIEDARQKLLDVAIFYSQWGPDKVDDKDYIRDNYLHGAWDGVQKIPNGKFEYHKQFRGKVSNVTFKNIEVIGGMLPFSVFHGFDSDKNVEDVIIDNLSYQGKKLTTKKEAKIRTQNTNNLVLK
ncbi:glycosyl hydrolase family 28 protein [Galbibacter mesophilus]|uniref:glycosyl hydrolase family 28 protein n=1 Tax=Galbibacter mesophilus TaxID=379069 RepID=UPI00191EA3BF|nr:glycosyl hydrolase family 28 protein [Galbibacter mesophilus]MCM5661847.1 glycosyl hydrolase family 28 protein [Galbibacter mesophilus]